MRFRVWGASSLGERVHSGCRILEIGPFLYMGLQRVAGTAIEDEKLPVVSTDKP